MYHKARSSDRDVALDTPSVRLAGRDIVLVDATASTGTTLAVAARVCLDQGARTVDVPVVDGLFVGAAVTDPRRAGVSHVWSTDSVLHPTNVLPLAPLLADAMTVERGIGEQETRCAKRGGRTACPLRTLRRACAFFESSSSWHCRPMLLGRRSAR